MSLTKKFTKNFTFFLIFGLFLCFKAQSQEIDLLLKGGHVIDPKNGINEPYDIGISGKHIVKVAKNISENTAKKPLTSKVTM